VENHTRGLWNFMAVENPHPGGYGISWQWEKPHLRDN